MSSIYDINFSLLGKNLLPPNKRKTNMEAWIVSLLKPLQYSRDLFLEDYAYGAVYPYWMASTLYNEGTRRLYSDNAAYECIETHTSATADNKPGTGTNWQRYWFQKDGAVPSGISAWADITSYTSSIIKRYNKLTTPTTTSTYPTTVEFYA